MQGSILIGNKLKDRLNVPNLSLDIPEDDTLDMPASPYDMIQACF